MKKFLYSNSLTTPQCIKDEIGSYANLKSWDPGWNKRQFISYIDIIDDTPLLRTWMLFFHVTKKKWWLEWAEICRREPNEKPIFCNCEYRGVCGWTFYDHEEWKEDQTWTWDKKNGRFDGKILNLDKFIENQAKYCAYKPEYGNFWSYYEVYYKNPKIELLVKAGYVNLINSINIMDLKAKSLDKILKVDKKWLELLKNGSRSELIACRCKYVHTEEDVKIYVRMLNDTFMKKFLSKSGKYFREMYEYLIKLSYHEERDYEDYIRLCEKFGFSLEQRKILMPEDLKTVHDELAAQYETIKNAETNKKIQIQYKNHEKYIFEDENYVIFPVSQVEELESESKALNHCVRTYAEKVANGETEIFFIRDKKDLKQSFLTLELKKKAIIQVRGLKNKNISSFDEKTIDFVKKWQLANKFNAYCW